jgi:hypothetical protein
MTRNGPYWWNRYEMDAMVCNDQRDQRKTSKQEEQPNTCLSQTYFISKQAIVAFAPDVGQPVQASLKSLSSPPVIWIFGDRGRQGTDWNCTGMPCRGTWLLFLRAHMARLSLEMDQILSCVPKCTGRNPFAGRTISIHSMVFLDIESRRWRFQHSDCMLASAGTYQIVENQRVGGTYRCCTGSDHLC